MSLRTCVASVPIFRGLCAADQAAVAARLRHLPLRTGDTLAVPGDEAALRVVRAGRIRQSRLTENGSEQLLRVLAHGDFTGETAVLTGQRESLLSVAMTDANVCVLSTQDLHAILAEQPSVAASMLTVLADRLAGAETQLLQITSRPVAARLGEYLAGLASALPAGARFRLPVRTTTRSPTATSSTGTVMMPPERCTSAGRRHRPRGALAACS